MTKPKTELLLPETDREEFATLMYTTGYFGIQENPDDYITLKSGRRSPHYFDVRPGISSYETRMFIANNMARLTLLRSGALDYPSLQNTYNYFVGSPEAMTSYGASIADIAEIGVLQPRVDMAKKSGNKSPILGSFTRGETVAAYDDVVTGGETITATIQALSSQGLNVVDYFVALDREEGGASEVESATGLIITPALGLANTVRILRANSSITQTQYDNVLAYMQEYGDEHAVVELER